MNLFQHTVELPATMRTHDDIEEVRRWCHANCAALFFLRVRGTERYTHLDLVSFEDKQDAVMFQLASSGRAVKLIFEAKMTIVEPYSLDSALLN